MLRPTFVVYAAAIVSGSIIYQVEDSTVPDRDKTLEPISVSVARVSYETVE